MSRYPERDGSVENWRIPRVILDAGGETWAILGELVWRRFEDLAAGQVLELVTVEPSVRADIIAWCGSAGHELLQILDDGNGIRFWIRKG